MFKNFPSPFGIAVGVIIGILIAPAKGKRTRNAITEKSNNLKHEVAQLYEESEIDLKTIKQIFINELLNITAGFRENLYGIISNVEDISKENKNEV